MLISSAIQPHGFSNDLLAAIGSFLAGSEGPGRASNGKGALVLTFIFAKALLNRAMGSIGVGAGLDATRASDQPHDIP